MKAAMKATPKLATTMKEASFTTEYRSPDRDPILLRCLMLMESSGASNTIISNRCGVSSQTLRNWKKGKTRRPQAYTLRFVLRAIGYELTIKRS